MKYLFARYLLIVTIFALVSACSLPAPIPPQQDCVFVVKPSYAEKLKYEKIERNIKELQCDYQEGYKYAAVCLGHKYLTGEEGVLKDLNQAYCWYKRAADAGISVAEVQIGHFYRDGCCVVSRDPGAAMRWYQCAAERGDVTGMLALGDMYKGWYGVKRDDKKAIYWYEQAMHYGSVEGEYQIAALLSQKPQKRDPFQGVDMLTKLAEECHPDAMATLGDLYLLGRFGAKDVMKAYEHYCRAAQLGSPEAMFKLAMLYDMGQGIVVEHAEALKWFTHAAEKGLPEAEKYMGDLYRDGRGVSKNYKTAAEWYYKSSEHGSRVANLELADLYHAGKGVPRSLEEAARRYELAAECGRFAYAELMLSILYEEARGVPYDLAKSTYYYKKASQQSGFHLAQYKIARRYATGFGFKQDIRKAMKWYYLAAESGLPIAQAELGDLFYSGEYAPQDFGKAFYWYQKAAKKGHSYAQNMLGLILLEGDCLPQYAGTTIPAIKSDVQRSSLPCNKCSKASDCTCVPAYSEQPGTECLCTKMKQRPQQVKCLKCQGINCHCGSRYAHRIPKWCANACSSNPYCLAARCKCIVSQQNSKQAATWIRKAACQGERQAQFQLGILYMQGIGVPKNDIEAYAWLFVGLEGMEDKTPEIIRCLLERMDSESKRKAACLAKKYQCLWRKTVQFPSR